MYLFIFNGAVSFSLAEVSVTWCHTSLATKAAYKTGKKTASDTL